MIAYKRLKAASHTPTSFLRRWHWQHRWRMANTTTRRMQLNTHRWYFLATRRQRALLLEMNGIAAAETALLAAVAAGEQGVSDE